MDRIQGSKNNYSAEMCSGSEDGSGRERERVRERPAPDDGIVGRGEHETDRIALTLTPNCSTLNPTLPQIRV